MVEVVVQLALMTDLVFEQLHSLVGQALLFELGKDFLFVAERVVLSYGLHLDASFLQTVDDLAFELLLQERARSDGEEVLAGGHLRSAQMLQLLQANLVIDRHVNKFITFQLGDEFVFCVDSFL